MDALELKEALYKLPCVVKDEPIHDRISIIFEHARMLSVYVDDDNDISIPTPILQQLTTDEVETLDSILWHFRATPPFMRGIEEWKERTAREAYFNNQQLLKESPLGALERHWILAEQISLKALF